MRTAGSLVLGVFAAVAAASAAPPGFNADAVRLNRLMLDGFVPLQFTYLQVVEEPDDCVATVREALATPEPQFRSPPERYARFWR